ncbi:MAG: class D beta-lactamase [Gammaproteobacteria bacterium]|nr:class D beta-lactamase [Gammaproteobacteria bacterium]
MTYLQDIRRKPISTEALSEKRPERNALNQTSVVGGLVACLIVSLAFGDMAYSRNDRSTAVVADLFEAEGLDGTLVVASSSGEILHVYNDERSKRRFSPASTFKIMNTLVALESAVISSQDSIFEWDGIDRGVPAWNRDQTLQTAFRVSCVWCYQELARRIGKTRYVSALAHADYGNQQVGLEVDQFWLNDVLQISAIEQIDFLSRLVDASIPYRREYVDIVKNIMLDEQSTDYIIHAKTGWTGANLHVGWYVGYVETKEDTWLFAMNMRMDRAEQAALRKELTVRSLRALGIL